MPLQNLSATRPTICNDGRAETKYDAITVAVMRQVLNEVVTDRRFLVCKSVTQLEAAALGVRDIDHLKTSAFEKLGCGCLSEPGPRMAVQQAALSRAVRVHCQTTEIYSVPINVIRWKFAHFDEGRVFVMGCHHGKRLSWAMQVLMPSLV
jgi:hypothetical protein